MTRNYISRGEVITLTAGQGYTSGNPYRINGFNGVALSTVSSGDLLSFQLEGIFEFCLEAVSIGDLIFINKNNELAVKGDHVFGRAVTSADSRGNFYCRLLQSE